jgi:hypothetical protein
LALASIANQVETTVPVSTVTATAASRAATALLRRHQRQARSTLPAGRAAIGSPRNQRSRSSASAAAEP